MVEIIKVNENSVGIQATSDEWDQIKLMLQFAAQNYSDTELEYSHISEDSVKNLFEQFQNLPSPPNKVHKEQGRLFVQVIDSCEICNVDGVTEDQKLQIIRDKRNFSFRDAFPQDVSEPGLQYILDNWP